MSEKKIHWHGRGSTLAPDARYLDLQRQAEDDGWTEQPLPQLKTVVVEEQARSLISRNDSPDLGFSQSINPYRGCEHGCIYCYARPTHAWQDLSPGIDFESRLFVKTNAVQVLRRELARPGYQPHCIMLSGNTDAWQPIEREWRITRGLLQLLAECRHPVAIVSKSALIERDIDILQELARYQAVEVYISLDTLDATLARRMDPRAASPRRRLETVSALSRAGIPTGVLVAPVIPWLTDHEIETTLTAAAEAGAGSAAYVMLRLPLELKDLFADWLQTHYPDKAAHVLSMVSDMHGGALYSSDFGRRMRGSGAFADMIRQRFALACRRLGLRRERTPLSAAHFCPPAADGQLSLF